MCVAKYKMAQFFSLALRVISCAVGNRAQQLPISQLAAWFGCSTADVTVLCTSCGFTANDDVVSILRPKFQQPQRVCSINLCNWHGFLGSQLFWIFV